jgi:O-antigen/teichoic acid export membrane protein
MTSGLFRRHIDSWTGVLRSRTARDTGFVMSGNLASAVLRFAVIALLARELLPADLGVLFVFTAVMDVVAGFCDSGLNNTLVRFMAGGGNGTRALCARVFWMKLVVTLAVAGLSALAAGPFLASQHIADEYCWAYALAVGAGVFLSLNTFGLSVLQGLQRFGLYAVHSVTMNAIRILAVGALMLAGSHSLGAYYGAFFGVTPLALFAAAVFVSISLPRGETPRSIVSYGSLTRFTFPLALMYAIAIVFSRADVLMLKALSTAEAVGQYGLGFQLAFFFSLVTTSLFVVLLPKVAMMKTRAELAAYRTRALHFYPLLIAATAAAVFAVPPILVLLFGDKYEAAVPINRILIAAFGLHVIKMPLDTIFFAANHPYYVTAVHALALAALVVSGFLLIPEYGGEGAAIASLLARIVSVAASVVLTGLVLREGFFTEADASNCDEPPVSL